MEANWQSLNNHHRQNRVIRKSAKAFYALGPKLGCWKRAGFAFIAGTLLNPPARSTITAAKNATSQPTAQQTEKELRPTSQQTVAELPSAARLTTQQTKSESPN